MWFYIKFWMGYGLAQISWPMWRLESLLSYLFTISSFRTNTLQTVQFCCQDQQANWYFLHVAKHIQEDIIDSWKINWFPLIIIFVNNHFFISFIIIIYLGICLYIFFFLFHTIIAWGQYHLLFIIICFFVLNGYMYFYVCLSALLDQSVCARYVYMNKYRACVLLVISEHY